MAVLIATLGTRPYAGGWNDGSRLATVESLVDHHTWAIDDSIFVKVPQQTDKPPPYPATQSALLANGTLDKMWIDGHFYSDKSPVPQLCMAGVYLVLQRTTGLVARERPDWFCYWITLFSSGLAYVVSVLCIFRLTGPARLESPRMSNGLTIPVRLLLTASFALGTIALPYAQQVNSHILLLGVCSALMLALAPSGKFSVPRLLAIGSLIGAGYTVDLGIGPVLVLCTTLFVAWKERNFLAPFLVLAAAFPWFAAHHALNYVMAGTFLPANDNPAHFQWPGSPFNASNMTGGLVHRNIGKLAVYALDLLFGKRGFLGHDPALFLALAGAVVLLRMRLPEKRHIWFTLAFMAGSWAIYSAGSNNYSGQCASIRWFVPLLAPGYYLLVLLLRADARYTRDLAVLTAGGIVLGALMFWKGPWMPHMVPGYWFILVPTLLAWAVVVLKRMKSEPRPASSGK